MSSLGHRATVLLLRLLNRRRIYTSPEGLMRGIEHTRRLGPAHPPPRLSRSLHVSKETFQGRDVYRLRPLGVALPAARVLYLHGGAYVRPITGFHWGMLAELVAATGFEFVVPFYPLAPESSGLAALHFVSELYRQEDADDVPKLLMGDSAGAGLILALAAVLRDSGTAPAKRLILITPWVDVEVSHPQAHLIAALDPMLGIEGLREAGKLYAGDLATSHPSISPARGDLAGMPPMTMFVGARDLLGPDAIEFASKGRQCGCDIELHVEPDMLHAWPLLGFAEAKKTRAEIVAVALAAIKGAGGLLDRDRRHVSATHSNTRRP